jgi:hypothetical protein
VKNYLVLFILITLCVLVIGCKDKDNIKSIGPATDVPTANDGQNRSDNRDNNQGTGTTAAPYYSSNYDPAVQGNDPLPDYSDQGYAYGQYVYDDNGYDLYLYYADGRLYDHVRVDYRSAKETVKKGLSGPNKATLNPGLVQTVDLLN